MEGQEPWISCPDGPGRHTQIYIYMHTLPRSIMALDFKADIGFSAFERVALCLLSKFNTVSYERCSLLV